MKKYKQGYYKPKNKEKWVVTNTFDGMGLKYRSSWELKFFKYIDNNKNIIKCNSEGLKIPYYNPVKKRISNYYVDFTIQTSKGDIFLIEIKPYKETKKPRKSKNLKSYKKRLETYLINQAKWEYAKKFAEAKGYKFVILTEKELFNN